MPSSHTLPFPPRGCEGSMAGHRVRHGTPLDLAPPFYESACAVPVILCCQHPRIFSSCNGLAISCSQMHVIPAQQLGTLRSATVSPLPTSCPRHWSTAYELLSFAIRASSILDAALHHWRCISYTESSMQRLLSDPNVAVIHCFVVH
jgi:hypothetical protein